MVCLNQEEEVGKITTRERVVTVDVMPCAEMEERQVEAHEGTKTTEVVQTMTTSPHRTSNMRAATTMEEATMEVTTAETMAAITVGTMAVTKGIRVKTHQTKVAESTDQEVRKDKVNQTNELSEYTLHSH